jgi:hypothetical protein
MESLTDEQRELFEELRRAVDCECMKNYRNKNRKRKYVPRSTRKNGTIKPKKPQSAP